MGAGGLCSTPYTSYKKMPSGTTDTSQRLFIVENHIQQIRDNQKDYEDALKELAQSMNQMAVAMAEREQDRVKLAEISARQDKLSEEFALYKEKQYEKEISNSRRWLWSGVQFLASIAVALIIFHLTKDVSFVPGH